MSRILLGAIAGICGTALMTAAMRTLHRGLVDDARYPLPPREITERVLAGRVPEHGVRRRWQRISPTAPRWAVWSRWRQERRLQSPTLVMAW
jgi:hypothetical protein